MELELLGFVTGIVGAVWMKTAAGLINEKRPHAELEKSIGREAEAPALNAFLRGLALVMIGLGLETYARLFH